MDNRTDQTIVRLDRELDKKGCLSVLLLTKNEEAQLAQCLQSVQWADEIIVVDGESTDRTTEIAKSFGAKVVRRPFSGSFAEERNAGLNIATSEWILQMDADERVTPQMQTAIEGVLKGPDRGMDAYQVYRRNIFLGRTMRHGGWYHRHLCLFRREGNVYRRRVHEEMHVKRGVGFLEVDLIHEPFKSLEQFVQRQNRYSTLEAHAFIEEYGSLPEKVIRKKLWQRPINLWWKFYVKKKGYREGIHGFVFSFLFAWLEFLVWAKYWELVCLKNKKS